MELIEDFPMLKLLVLELMVVIKSVYKFKYLGVVFDKHISWSTHVKYVLSRVGKRVRILRRIRALNTHCVNFIYTSLIRPVLDYCDIV